MPYSLRVWSLKMGNLGLDPLTVSILRPSEYFSNFEWWFPLDNISLQWHLNHVTGVLPVLRADNRSAATLLLMLMDVFYHGGDVYRLL
jgi:hypothetical protein